MHPEVFSAAYFTVKIQTWLYSIVCGRASQQSESMIFTVIFKKDFKIFRNENIATIYVTSF